MQTRRPPLHLAALLALAACSSGSPTKPAADAARAIDAATADAPTANVAMVPAEAADAICGALFRCCESDQALYFAPYRGNDLLAAFKDRLPPDATLDETSCKAVVKDMLTVVPLGDWVSAAQRGEATFDAAAFATCIGALDTAACGEPMRAALWDSTCLGFAPPGGGAEQRRFFHRDHGVGSTCGPIRDGIGAALFGTCDPTTSFCCYSDPAHPGCQMPYDD
ncbi:MAG: hypothetical protein K8W52_26440, partial [Deltaproteobacteria bacterium]|nr:hypothetical protein [Deltaproteobacteria bacterium]